jgi:hypothetical protein
MRRWYVVCNSIFDVPARRANFSRNFARQKDPISASIASRVLRHIARNEAISLSALSSRATSWLSYRYLSDHVTACSRVNRNILRWEASEMPQQEKQNREPWLVQVPSLLDGQFGGIKLLERFWGTQVVKTPYRFGSGAEPDKEICTGKKRPDQRLVRGRPHCAVLQ